MPSRHDDTRTITPEAESVGEIATAALPPRDDAPLNTDN
jgi:hypothetical protein